MYGNTFGHSYSVHLTITLDLHHSLKFPFAHLRCIDCEEWVAIDDSISCGGVRCKKRRCKKCHCGRRSLRSWYVKADRVEEWDNMSVEEKRQFVVANKDKGGGKGVKRDVNLLEKSKCEDSLQLASKRPFLTKKQSLCSVSCMNILFLL